MKIILPISFILVLLLATTESCKRGCFKNKDKIEGIIESEFDFGECFDHYDAPNDEYVITDDRTYQSINLEIYTSKPNCETPIYPEIDFSKHTLLGKSASGGEADFIREVEKDENNKRYVYTIRVLECNGLFNGGKYRTDMNWILVPKLPQDYTVEFEVKYK